MIDHLSGMDEMVDPMSLLVCLLHHFPCLLIPLFVE